MLVYRDARDQAPAETEFDDLQAAGTALLCAVREKGGKRAGPRLRTDLLTSPLS